MDSLQPKKPKFSTPQLEQIAVTLLGLLETGNFSDVTFHVGSEAERQTYRCHKAILSSRSTYFEKLFLSGLEESHSNEVVFPTVDPKVFDHVLKFLYGSIFDLEEEELSLAFCIYQQADEWLLDQLKVHTAQFIQFQMGIETIWKIFEYSVKNRCFLDLKSKCIEWFNRDVNRTLKSMANVIPKVLSKEALSQFLWNVDSVTEIHKFEFVVNWLGFQSPDEKNKLREEILGLIDYRSIARWDLLRLVYPTNLVSHHVILDAMHETEPVLLVPYEEGEEEMWCQGYVKWKGLKWRVKIKIVENRLGLYLFLDAKEGTEVPVAGTTLYIFNSETSEKIKKKFASENYLSVGVGLGWSSFVLSFDKWKTKSGWITNGYIRVLIKFPKSGRQYERN